jgi:hypothetical protein
VRLDRGADLGARAAQLFHHAGPMGLEVLDLVVDLAAPAQALLDRLRRVGGGVLAGAALVVVGLRADLLRVGLRLRAQLGAVLIGWRLSSRDSCSVVSKMCAVDLPTRSSLRVTATCPISYASSVSSPSTSCSRTLSTSRLS